MAFDVKKTETETTKVLDIRDDQDKLDRDEVEESKRTIRGRVDDKLREASNEVYELLYNFRKESNGETADEIVELLETLRGQIDDVIGEAEDTARSMEDIVHDMDNGTTFDVRVTVCLEGTVRVRAMSPSDASTIAVDAADMKDAKDLLDNGFKIGIAEYGGEVKVVHED